MKYAVKRGPKIWECLTPDSRQYLRPILKIGKREYKSACLLVREYKSDNSCRSAGGAFTKLY